MPTVITDLLPQGVVVTAAKAHDLQVAKTLRLGPGYLLIFDRAYLDYAWLNRRHGRNVSFVTRLKRNSRDSVVATYKESDDRVLADQVIRFSSPRAGMVIPRISAGSSITIPNPARPMIFSLIALT